MTRFFAIAETPNALLDVRYSYHESGECPMSDTGRRAESKKLKAESGCAVGTLSAEGTATFSFLLSAFSDERLKVNVLRLRPSAWRWRSYVYL
jgi:hypothetical protein